MATDSHSNLFQRPLSKRLASPKNVVARMWDIRAITTTSWSISGMTMPSRPGTWSPGPQKPVDFKASQVVDMHIDLLKIVIFHSFFVCLPEALSIKHGIDRTMLVHCFAWHSLTGRKWAINYFLPSICAGGWVHICKVCENILAMFMWIYTFKLAF